MHRDHPQLRQLLIREMVDGAPRLPALVRELGDSGPRGLRAFLEETVAAAGKEGLAPGIPTAHLLAIILAMGQGLMAFAPLLTEVLGLDPRDPATADAVGRSAATVIRRTLAADGKE